MISLRSLSRLLVLTGAIGMLAGCSSDSDRSRVQGEVRYNGERVDDGGIAFIPEGEALAQVRATGEIRDGRYNLDSNRGPYPGNYRVEIFWHKKTGQKIANRTGTAFKEVTQQAIPAKYNESSELRVEVKPGRNTFDFDLKP